MSETPPESAPKREDDSSVFAALVFALAAVLVLVLTLWLNQRLLQLAKGNVYDLRAFQHLFVRFDVPASWWAAGVLAGSAVLSFLVPEGLVDRTMEWIGAHRRLVALLVIAVLGALAPLVYQDYPLAVDEFAPWFQAKIFATGKLYAMYPPDLIQRMLPVPDQFFRFSPITGQAIQANYPSWATILTPFTLLGVPWLANPIAAGGLVLLAGYIADQLFPERKDAAGWAILLTVASPLVTVNALSYYTMNMHLLVSLGYTALLLQPTPKRVFLAGLVGSLGLTLNNPLPHTVFAIPWLLWLAFRPGRVKNIALIGLGYVPAAVIGPLWMYLQSQVPIVVRGAAAAAGESPKSLARIINDQLHNSVFGLQPWLPFSLVRGMWLSKLYFWAVPGLVVIAALGFWRLRGDVRARLMAASFAVTALAYTFVRVDQGHGWGARYFHPAFGALAVLGTGWLVIDPVGQRWRRYFLVLAVGSLCVLTPLRLRQVHEFIAEARANTPAHDPTRPQLIFLYPWPGKERYYAWDAVRNDPFLRTNTIIIASADPKKDEELIQRLYPGATLASKGTHGSVWNLP